MIKQVMELLLINLQKGALNEELSLTFALLDLLENQFNHSVK